MNLTLVRSHSTDKGVFGEILDDAGKHLVFTLEHSYQGTVDVKDTEGKALPPIWVAKLPYGTFTCKRGQHQLHSGPIETFEVTGVPGHTGILIHPGNTEDASEGCILVGIGRTFDQAGGGLPVALTQSRDAFKAFLDLQAGVDEFELLVRN